MSVISVGSGQVFSDRTVSSGTTLEVGAGGSAFGDVVASGATLLEFPAFYVTGISVLSGISVFGTVVAGGAVHRAVVHAGGTVEVGSNAGDAAGSLVGDIVLPGGQEIVYGGGTTTGTRLKASGGRYVGQRAYQSVSSGGVASGTEVLSGAGQDVQGSAVGTVIDNGGIAGFDSGGRGTGDIVLSGGQEVIYSGGTTTGSVVRAGGLQDVFSGGVASGTVLRSGGVQSVESGGVASATQVGAGGYMEVSASVGGVVGNAYDAVVFTGGTLEVGFTTVGAGWYTEIAGGTAQGTLLRGGVEYVSYGGSAIGGDVRSGLLSVVSGGTAQGVTVWGAGATEAVAYGGETDHGQVKSGGVLSVGGLAAFESVLSGGTVEVLAGGVASSFAFLGTGGTLAIQPTGGALDGLDPVGNFRVGDTVELLGVTAGTAAAQFASGHQIAISAGGQVYDLALDPAESFANLVPVASAVAGNVVLTLAASAPPPPPGGPLLAEAMTGTFLVAHS